MDLSEFHPRYFEAAEQDGLVVVTFSVSHINDEENIEELGHEVFALVDQFGFRKVALSMANVEYITSSVVGKIITLHRKLHWLDGQLVVCDLTPGVHEILSASRLLTYFSVAETTADALRILAVEGEGTTEHGV
ncbi:MAG: STAS domain-containing protein [Planctomycetota bacterium]|nr:STAS domain-containing protein [Planctomycetota bacterium]MDA1248619.1 STAS domain-containing protein [Planctomycetota bacterium]